MSFYQSIASSYDHIFPPQPEQLTFTKSCLNDDAQSVLDIGCGTGNLTFQLASAYEYVCGIDLNMQMLKLAIEKRGYNPHPQFKAMNMLQLLNSFEPKSFDGVICFGNTLVHLGSIKEIKQFIVDSAKLLKESGHLLIQSINYDRIISQKINSLPTIETDEVTFVRNYRYLKAQNKIEFETILTEKATGNQVTNCIKLYPLLQDELDRLLVKSGFININYYGNFKGEDFTENSQPLIVSAQKKA